MPRKLVICSDGTWNSPDQKDDGEFCPTNVVKTALGLADKSPDGIPQVLFYDKGVGTKDYLDRMLGGGFGFGLSDNILDCYRFLVQNYEEGDELYFFGFSRGAYTSRSTAGLVRNCGILRREHAGRIDEAFALYRRRDANSHPRAIESQIFRRMYSRDVRIKFIGVWDTVGALGVPLNAFRVVNKLLNVQFHDTTLSTYVDNAFQALAIDEKRGPFKPALWERSQHAEGQRLEQVWFAGVHSDIGGGYLDSGLSGLAFEWMRSRAELCGLAFEEACLEPFKIRADFNGELHVSRKGFYKLIPAYERPIGKAVGGSECVHPSALDRLAKGTRPYPAENLVAYLEEQKGKGTSP